jgi:serine/threonine protein kinase
MERAQFGSLREYLLSVDDSGPLKPVIAMEIALQVCRAMQQLTALSVIHRDSRPGTYWCSRSPVAVTTMCWSRSATSVCLDRRRLPAITTTVMRSPSHAVVLTKVLQRRKHSEKSDVWAFGVTFWEVLSLALVPYYECTSDEQVVRAIVAGTKLAAPAGYPAAVFERCVLPCLATAANDRPDFTRLLQALRVVQEELLIQEATENPTQAERMCCICLTSRSCYAIIPCGHQCLCEGVECTAAFQPPRRAHCPICRTPVTSLLHVFA